jgi:hypothetical protein
MEDRWPTDFEQETKDALEELHDEVARLRKLLAAKELAMGSAAQKTLVQQKELLAMVAYYLGYDTYAEFKDVVEKYAPAANEVYGGAPTPGVGTLPTGNARRSGGLEPTKSVSVVF